MERNLQCLIKVYSFSKKLLNNFECEVSFLLPLSGSLSANAGYTCLSAEVLLRELYPICSWISGQERQYKNHQKEGHILLPAKLLYLDVLKAVLTRHFLNWNHPLFWSPVLSMSDTTFYSEPQTDGVILDSRLSLISQIVTRSVNNTQPSFYFSHLYLFCPCCHGLV